MPFKSFSGQCLWTYLFYGHLTLKQDLPNSIASSDTERKLKMHMA